MLQSYPVYWPQFFTATIFEWNHLLKNNEYKDVIIETLRYLTENKWIELNAFVIMSNHIHLIWRPLGEHTPTGIQSSFMKFTAKELKGLLLKNEADLLTSFMVNKCDRKYQIWKREPLGVELKTTNVFNQKLNYIHQNPIRAGLCKDPEAYYYSSARYYQDGTNSFNILTGC